MEINPIIEVKNLSRKFGKFTAVDSISFKVFEGEIFGFLGANGAGKTTAIKMLTGLLESSSGEATVAGFDINKQKEQIKKQIGYMSQKFSLYEDLTVYENIRFYAGIYGLKSNLIDKKIDELLSGLDLSGVKNSLISSLPLGWRQKLAFMTAMVHNPRIVFLDEPTSGVDPVTRRQFWNMIYETAAAGCTIFVTTHYMDEAEYCDRISIMVSGRIEALGTPHELKSAYKCNSINDVFVKLARN